MRSLKSTTMALAILLLTSAHVDAQGARQAIVTATNVQVMAEPSFSAAPLAPAAQGSQLLVLEVSGDWVRVFHDQKQGFVHTAFVSITGGQPNGGQTQAAPAMTGQNTAAQNFGGQGARSGGSVASLQAGDVGYKDPSLARIIGVVFTGGGQIYAGRTGKGLALLGTAFGAAVIGGAMSAASIDYDCGWNETNCDYTPSYAPLYLGYAVALAAWGYGWYTAPDDAAASNVQQARQRYGSLPAQPILAPAQSGGVAVGMRIPVN